MKTQDYFHIVDDGKLKTSEVLDKCKKLFDVYSYLDDKQLDKYFPKVKSNRYFEKNIEADEEFKNKSADDLEKEGVQGITLRERLLMEIKHFTETGQHLDVENVTLCSGSRYSGGLVPSVNWGAGYRRLYVSWYHPTDRPADLRSRAAVIPSTLKPLSLSSKMSMEEAFKDMDGRIAVLEVQMSKLKDALK